MSYDDEKEAQLVHSGRSFMTSLTLFMTILVRIYVLANAFSLWMCMKVFSMLHNNKLLQLLEFLIIGKARLHDYYYVEDTKKNK